MSDLVLSIPKLGPVIAIDGPAGTGKSSATQRLSEALGFVHIDTGALYRAIAFLTLEQRPLDGKGEGDSRSEEETAVSLARTVHLEFRRMSDQNPSNRIFANGRDLTLLIRTPQVTMEASRVSAFPQVRAALVGLQRRLGCSGKAILEGRDIGTVIFPDADFKFFLTASVDERAKRRLIELEALGKDTPSFEEVKAQIIARDQGDMSRAVAPLRKAQDAFEIDTSAMTLDQVVALMAALVKERLHLPPTPSLVPPLSSLPQK